MADAERELTPKEERFCREYLRDLNATQAAIRCGYSKRTAGEQASRLLANVRIASHIKYLQDARAKRLEIRTDRVLEEVARVAFMDMADFGTWDEQGNFTLHPSTELMPDQTACISEMAVTERGKSKTLKFKLHSKTQALDKLCKHLGLYKERGPLDALLDALPPEVATQLREALAAMVTAGLTKKE